MIEIKCCYDKLIPIEDVKPHHDNENDHSLEQIEVLAKVIKKDGVRHPITISNLSRTICMGHGRLLAFKILGMKQVPIEFQDFDDPIQEMRVRNSDNNIARYAEINQKKFDINLGKFELNRSDIDIEEYGIIKLETEEEDDDGKSDDVPEVDEKDPLVVKGDIWLLGNHRVKCGDSTNKEDVNALMDNQKADMVFIDPPYNTGMTKSKNIIKGGLIEMFNDDYTDDEWEKFMTNFCSMVDFVMKDNTAAYICLDWKRNYQLIPHIKNNFELSNTIVWDKVVPGFGSNYKFTYELINVCRKGKPEIDTYQGDREYSDVWHIQRTIGKNKDHATAKPTEVVSRCLRHASKPNSLVVDIFLGSGSTLIACEKVNRICFGMEIDETYCKVIIERFIKYVEDESQVFLLDIDGKTKIPYREVVKMRTGNI